MAKLYLPLKGVYFDQIKSGQKFDEYRLANEYWAKRLEGREYSEIVLTRGYPKKGDLERTLRRPWRGFFKKKICHPHFGPNPVLVYAIAVNDPVEKLKTLLGEIN